MYLSTCQQSILNQYMEVESDKDIKKSIANTKSALGLSDQDYVRVLMRLSQDFLTLQTALTVKFLSKIIESL